MKNTLQLIIAALLLLLSQTAGAQLTAPATTHGAVKGRLSDVSGTGVGYATVSLLKASDSSKVRSGASDSVGRFSFEGLDSGRYVLSVSVVGYRGLTKPLTLGGGDSLVDMGSLVIEQDPHALKTATVIHRKPLIERQLDKTVLNVENSLLSTGSTALELLQLAPGITIANNDKVQLNGKSTPLIMIDGKPTYLSDAQLTNLLKTMPSNMISEIEIISQPSAKYDAAGVSGIINIRTKQNKLSGFTGSVTGGPGYGRGAKARGNVNLNYKTDKLSLSLDYSYSYNHSIRDLEVDRQLPDSNGFARFDRTGRIDSKLQSHNYKAGMLYSINNRHSIGLQVMGYTNTEKLNTKTTTNILDGKNVLDSVMLSNAKESSTYNNIGANLNYRGKLDSVGTELSFDADWAHFGNSIHRDFVNSLYTPHEEPIGPTDYIRNNFPTTVDIAALKADFVLPIGHKARFEAGVKSSWVKTDNDARYDSLLSGEWVKSLSQSNHFIYKENINAAYVNFRKTFSSLSLQGGLRMEQTNTNGNLVTLEDVTKRSYLNFFPSVFISDKAGKNNVFSASYSRRIQRPGYQDLNPFRFFDDRYTYSEGNPFLQPAYTNSFELSHSWKNELTSTLRYGVTTGVITEDIEQDPNTNITHSQLINLDKLTNYSLSVSYSKDITPWWSTDNTVTLNRSEYKDNSGGSFRDFHNYDVTLNLYQSFRLSKDLSADVGAFYLSPWLYGFIKAQAQYKVDVGVKKTFWNKKASIRLRVSDIFNTNRFRGEANYNGNVRVFINNHFESRVGFLTFTYLFGNTKLKVQKQKAGGSTEEQDRVKKSGLNP
jgi:outer membrane cobalamin receptor